MLTFTGDWINQQVVLAILMSIRIFGVWMTMPLFAFKALNMRMRVVLSLLLAFVVYTSQPVPSAAMAEDFGLLTVFSEWGIGLFCGWIMRVGLMTMDMIAEVLSMQAGLSFAASMTHDPAMSSGLIGDDVSIGRSSGRRWCGVTGCGGVIRPATLSTLRLSGSSLIIVDVHRRRRSPNA